MSLDWEKIRAALTTFVEALRANTTDTDQEC